MENTSSDLDDSWGAGLPCDLVRCIGDRLDEVARICFRAVCRSWRAALPVGRVTSITSPFVVIPAKPKRAFPCLSLDRYVGVSCGDTTSTSTSTALALHIVVDEELRLVGSSGGWLAVADSDSVIRLVNAMTLQEAARLPPLPRSAPDTCVPSFPLQFNHVNTAGDWCGHTITIHKVAFSVEPPRARGSSYYAHSAAALHRPTTGPMDEMSLTFTRSGWDRWVCRQPIRGYHGHFDVAYCQQSGVYYVATPRGSVWVLDMSAPVPTLEPFVTFHESVSFAVRRHLVVLSDDDGNSGSELSLSKHMYLVMIRDETEKQRVVVHKYTAEESWWPVSHLRGRALLISSRAEAVLVLPAASSLPWLRADCVYWMTGNEYTDDGYEGMSPVWRFHLPTNTTDRFVAGQKQLGDDHGMLDWHNSLWVTPSFTTVPSMRRPGHVDQVDRVPAALVEACAASIGGSELLENNEYIFRQLKNIYTS